MTKWVILLRAVGTFVFIVGGIGGVQYMISVAGLPNTMYSFYNGGIWVMIHIPLSILCFAAAAALKRIDLQDRKLNYIANRLNNRAPRRIGTNPNPPRNYPLPPSMLYPDPRNLAPDAPAPANTAHYADEGERIRHVGNGRRVITRVEQEYIDRKYAYRLPNPEVRAAPRPSRQSPGAAGQYMDEELEATKKRPLPNPSNPFTNSIEEIPDRDLRRGGRDAYLRRKQTGQE